MAHSKREEEMKVKFIIIHSTESGPSKNLKLKDIDRAHRMEGKLTCGYHFVIGRDGEVEPGRDTSRPGQHTPGQNQHSIGIVMVGGFTKKGPANNYNEIQMQSLRDLVNLLLTDHPGAEVVGHNHFNPHSPCPCFDVAGWLKT
jgi:N-acetylmuramoyl-L-alanine amidase